MSHPFLTFDDITLKNQRVMLREDLNVPMQQGEVSNDARIRAVLPSIRAALQGDAAVILLSHLGRPQEGKFDAEFSLAPIAEVLSQHLKQPVRFLSQWIDGISIQPGEVVLCENVRFLKGEDSNSEELSRRIAALCDVYVMDAFATAHRAQASTVGAIKYARTACAGPLLTAELTALTQSLHQPKRPLIAIVGGSKVSTKIQLLSSLLEKVDGLIVGGGIANTFLCAQGFSVGASLYEPDWVPEAEKLLHYAAQKNIQLPLPSDVVVAESMSATAKATTISPQEISAQQSIFDVGPQTLKMYQTLLQSAQTIIWNGPVGVFEIPQFSTGTQNLAQMIAASSAYSIAGGGDTLAAIEQFGVEKSISYLSTGGGAFLAFLEGDDLPAVDALKQKVSLKI